MSLPRTAREVPMDQWPETTARVMSSEYQYADWFSAAAEEGIDESYFLTAFSYRANGELYISEHRTSEPQPVGDEFTISFDPADPQYNSLTGPREAPVAWLVKWSAILLFSCFVLYLVSHFDLNKDLDN